MFPNIAIPILAIVVGISMMMPLLSQKLKDQKTAPRVQMVDWRFSDLGSIEGDGLTINPLEHADLDAYFDSIDDLVVQNNGWRVETFKSIQRLKQHSEEAAGLLNGNIAAIVPSPNQQVVGEVTAQVMTRRHDSDQRTVEVGIHVHADHRGRGLGTRALVAAIGRLTEIGWPRIVIGCSRSNRSMVAVATAVGGVEYHCGLLKMANGEVVDTVWFEICC